jgi:hypothetical protein
MKCLATPPCWIREIARVVSPNPARQEEKGVQGSESFGKGIRATNPAFQVAYAQEMIRDQAAVNMWRLVNQTSA